MAVKLLDVNVKSENGTAAAPSIGFRNSPIDGLFSKSVGTIGLAIGGSEVGSLSSTVLSTSVLVGMKQATDNVTDAGPTQAELVTALGAANQASGLVGFIKDNNADTNFFICASNGTSWYFLKMTKGA